MIQHEQDNVRFSIYRQERRPIPNHPQPGDGTPFWVFNATRISDGHHLPGQILTDTDITTMMDEIVAAWFDEHGALAAEPPATPCYSCGTALVSDHDTEFAFDNALWVELHGGYGMFVECEPFVPEQKVVICHECAHAACDALPWLARLIDPHKSHSHRTDYIKAHPDHTGWDYDRRDDASLRG